MKTIIVADDSNIIVNIVKRAFEEGHYIANHGYSHEYAQLYSSIQAVVDEFNLTEISIQNALETSEYHSYLFRFPGGSSGGYYKIVKAQAREHLNSYGFAFTNWNCLTGDAEGANTKEKIMCF